LDPVASFIAFPQPLPVARSQPSGQPSEPGLVQDLPGVAQPSENVRGSHSPQLDQVAISRILLNAESLIASIIGLNAYQVSVNVNIARYGA